MPTRIYKTPFAATGDKEALATADQPDGKVSLQAGWTPDYELPNDNANYRPVGRAEMNGVFNELTEALGEMQLNGFAKWQSIDGGWPLGAQVSLNGTAYRSTTDANVTTPGSTGAAWVPTNATAIADVTGLQAALDGKQPKGDYQTALGYTPVNKAGDQMTGNLSIKKNVPIVGLVSATGGVAWEMRGNFSGATDYGVQFWNIAQNAQVFRIGGNGEKEVFVREHRVWHQGNFNPADKAPVGRDCVWQSDAVETGGSVSPGGNYAYNVPDGYVVVGARTQSGVNSMWFRAVKIGTPQAW